MEPTGLNLLIRLGSLVCAGIALPDTALAHHSYAMFDRREVVIKGTVRDFDWTNPHVFLTVLAPDGEGGSTLWGVEGAGVNDYERGGWRFNILKPGDKVTVGIAPLHNGQHGGAMIFVQKADGTYLNGGPFARILHLNGAPK